MLGRISGSAFTLSTASWAAASASRSQSRILSDGKSSAERPFCRRQGKKPKNTISEMFWQSMNSALYLLNASSSSIMSWSILTWVTVSPTEYRVRWTVRHRTSHRARSSKLVTLRESILAVLSRPDWCTNGLMLIFITWNLCTEQ